LFPCLLTCDIVSDPGIIKINMNTEWPAKKEILIVAGIIIAAVVFFAVFNNGEEEIEVQATNQSSTLLTTTNTMPQSKSEVVIETNLGAITIELFNNKAPKTVANFIKLIESDFYDQTKFHRVIRDFMIQGGDPNSKGDQKELYGRGGPGYAFEDEINDEMLVRGVLAMANSGPNTNGSQFFIITAAQTPWLDGKHTPFGKVISGMNVVDKIGAVAVDANDIPVEPVVITSIQIKGATQKGN